MSARYFRGETVTGLVSASDARTFKDVADTLRTPPMLDLSREEFLSLSPEKRNEKKQVPFFVPAIFKSSPSKRVYDQAQHCNLIFLDIDPEKEMRDGKWVETGVYPAAPFVENPQLLYEALQGHNFVAHVTASSTPEKPRMRIVVDADKIPLDQYASAAMTIANLLGLPSITRESKVAVQPMFLPIIFNDTPEEEHPVIAYHLDGRAFTTGDINGGEIPTNGKNGTNGAHSTNGQHGVDALEFLRTPVDGINLATVKEALEYVDADCSRQEWLDKAAGMKHQFSPHLANEAYELFDEWSQKGSKYKGEDETRAAWKSLKPTPIGRVPMTIRSLLHKAREAGWNDQKVRENLLSTTMRWFEETGSVMDLIDHGVRRIAATPLMGSVQEDMLIHSLCQQAKDRFSHKLTTTAVRKDLQRIKAQISAKEQPAQFDQDPPWCRDIWYILGPDEFYRVRTGEKIKRTAFDAAYSRWLMPTRAALEAKSKLSGLPITPAEESTPTVLPSQYALNKIKVGTAQDYAYNPALPNHKWFTTSSGSKVLNTYIPTYPSADHRYAAEAGRLLNKHLGNLIAEPDNRRRLIDFLAYQVQFPGRKIRYGVLIQGTEGAGKTFLAEMMKSVLGAEHVRVIDGTAIKSGWNEWSFGSQLVVLEEVKVSGTSKYEIMNSLKPLITNDEISINERFRNQRVVANITNYLIFSNHHDALALTPGDRRYFVIKSPLQTKAQVLALGEDYFNELFGFLKLHPGGMRAYLLDWEISDDFDPNGHAPRTSYVEDMVEDTANELSATIRRMLLEADYPLIQFDIVSSTALRTTLIHAEEIRKATAQQVAHVLREEGMVQVGRHLIGDDRHYLWARPGITEKEAFETACLRVKKNLKNLSMELLF